MVDNNKKVKIKYAATEALYYIDGGKSVETIHERNDHRYVGSPGVARIDISKKVSKQVVDLEGSENEEDDMITISNLSREAIMDLICKQNKNKTGSYPKDKYNKTHSKTYEVGDEEINSDWILSDSSLNSSDEIRFGQDAAGKE